MISVFSSKLNKIFYTTSLITVFLIVSINYAYSGLTVDGKIRGKATYSIDSYHETEPLKTTSELLADEVSASITVQTNDVVMVMLSCSFTNESAAATNIDTVLSEGNAITLLTPTRITAKNQYSYYTSGANFGLYQALSDGMLKFQAKIIVYAGRANVNDCKIIAYIIGTK